MTTKHSQNLRSPEIPFTRSFSGHETFALRYFWLKKGVDELISDPEAFQSDDAIVRFGVGKNMVRSIRHWCLASRVIEEEIDTRRKRLQPTFIGKRLLTDDGWDPFMEDEATLWLIHWNLASKDTRIATWYLGFNRFHEYGFTRETMVDYLSRTVKTLGWNNIPNATIKRDVDCFVHMYLMRGKNGTNKGELSECPLTSLGMLVEETSDQRLRFSFGPKASLPAAIFAYALAEFWNRECPERKTLDFQEIMQSEGSPALIFRLDRDSVLCYLDELGHITSGGMVFEDTAIVRCVVKTDELPLDSLSYLEAYYANT